MKILSLPNTKIHSGNLILVNANHKFHALESTDLVSITNTASAIQLERHAASLLLALMCKIHAQNKIVPVSGWRSFKEQQTIWDESLADSGEEFTRKYVAIPGHSEHQTGLAIDLGLKQDKIDFICPEFPYSGICETFRKLAANYGFIERYPAGKESVTGIGHEPWHFRYVGIPHALIMSEHHLTLEEYMDFIKNHPYKTCPYHYKKHGLDIVVSYLKASDDKWTSIEIDTDKPYMISGNNIDGFIITEWRRIDG